MKSDVNVVSDSLALRRERDELRAEIERLQGSQLASEVARANQRNDDLQAEVETWRGNYESRERMLTEARTEIERLRALLSRLYTWDMMDSADGPYWRDLIEQALAKPKECDV